MSKASSQATLQDYLADILEDNENHKKSFSFSLETLSIENLAPGVLRLLPNPLEEGLEPLVLSCGVHGNETAPIEILNDILADIVRGETQLKKPTLMIFGHLAAMRSHQRFIDFNMNRLFCGNHKNYPEAQESPRARELEQLVSEFYDKYGKGHHYDLHTAIRSSHLKRFAVFPTSTNSRPNQTELDSLKAMGIEGLLVAGGKASTFSAYTHQTHQAVGYTLELGKVEPFGKNKRSDFKEAEDFLRKTLANEVVPAKDAKLKIYNVEHEMIKDSDDYSLHISEDYANFTPLAEGQPIETTRNGILKAKKDQAIVFPNSKVAVGQRTGLLVSLVNQV